MTNAKSTKRALLTSVVALILCFTMLLGTTFAWFTDSVTSSGNIIKSGNLDVGMYWADGGESVPAVAIPVADENWINAANGPMFTYKKWEPGYVEAKHILITNEGSLAFNYELRIITNEVISELADVIDVYYFETATDLERADVATGVHLGTLSDIMSTEKNISNTVKGSLLAGGTRTLSLAFAMQTGAGNEYQGLTLGEFAIQLVASQMAHEEDSFDKNYDADALIPGAPASRVIGVGRNEVITSTNENGENIIVVNNGYNIVANMGIDGPIENLSLNVIRQFQPTESYEEMLKSEYKYYVADFIVTADRDVSANSMALAGYYSAWCDNLNGNRWVALTSNTTVAAGTPVRLIKGLMGGGDYTVHYKDICQYGNDGIGFLCGAVDLSNGANAGTTLTVKLCLFETEADPNGSSASNVEVGSEPIVIGEYTYTFPAKSATNAANLNSALASGGEVVLENDIYTETTITAPYNNKVGYIQNGGVLNGNGNSLGITNSGDHYAIMTSGGTITNVKVDDGFRGIVVMNPTQTVYVDNVTVGGESVCYALNTAEGDGTQSIVVTNSTLSGWTSIGNTVKDVTFTNCKFGQGGYDAYPPVYGRLVKPYVNAVFENCDFIDMCYIDLSALGDGQTIVLKNCTINGQPLTADKIVAESECGAGQITIESKTGTYDYADWSQYVTIVND